MNTPAHFSKAVFVLRELMKRIQYSRILSCDTHHVEQLKNGTEVVSHVFNISQQKLLMLTFHSFMAQGDYVATVCLDGDLSIDSCLASEEGCQYFVDIVIKNSLLTLFFVSKDEIKLGPFFSKQSELRSRLVTILEQQEDIPAIPLSQNIWQAIVLSGGVPNIRDIWEELFEEDIKIKLLIKYPFCLDADIESIV